MAITYIIKSVPIIIYIIQDTEELDPWKKCIH